ncbi:hypothetical protein LTS18_012629 [Coniosporium uncinatum]|uniref:Uncharacterized protein n=1 Tax=Coniosporium uncinatum TaxID=93489 RepID=A0ACC3DWA0_9PEZI|nr:hypothetical protein LTS18_012629 [Coniosporium uncinatum]
MNRIHDVLDADLIWNKFLRNAVDQGSNLGGYQRVNVDLGNEPPRIDAVEHVESMQQNAASKLKTHRCHTQVMKIAYRLIASSFFFEPNGPVEDDDGDYRQTG